MFFSLQEQHERRFCRVLHGPLHPFISSGLSDRSLLGGWGASICCPNEDLSLLSCPTCVQGGSASTSCTHVPELQRPTHQHVPFRTRGPARASARPQHALSSLSDSHTPTRTSEQNRVPPSQDGTGGASGAQPLAHRQTLTRARASSSRSKGSFSLKSVRVFMSLETNYRNKRTQHALRQIQQQHFISKLGPFHL